MVKDELVSRVSSSDPDNISGIDMSLASRKRTFAEFPRHEEREEGLFVDDLVDFLEQESVRIVFYEAASGKSRTSNTTTHRFPSLSARNSARVDVEGSSYGLIE